jgi:hypothetical protein
MGSIPTLSMKKSKLIQLVGASAPTILLFQRRLNMKYTECKKSRLTKELAEQKVKENPNLGYYYCKECSFILEYPIFHMTSKYTISRECCVFGTIERGRLINFRMSNGVVFTCVLERLMTKGMNLANAWKRILDGSWVIAKNGIGFDPYITKKLANESLITIDIARNPDLQRVAAKSKKDRTQWYAMAFVGTDLLFKSVCNDREKWRRIYGMEDHEVVAEVVEVKEEVVPSPPPVKKLIPKKVGYVEIEFKFRKDVWDAFKEWVANNNVYGLPNATIIEGMILDRISKK